MDKVKYQQEYGEEPRREKKYFISVLVCSITSLVDTSKNDW